MKHPIWKLMWRWPKTWTCPICGRASLSERELKAHALLLHNDGDAA